MPFNICIIGAGYSGICAGIKFSQELPGSEITIYDENEEIGGTWLVNKYPGCACDIASHLYSFSFELNPDWTESYSSQWEILQYLLRVVDKYDIRKYMQLCTRITSTTWMDDLRQWKVEILDLKTNLSTERYFDIMLLCVGGLRVPHIPPEYSNTIFRGPVMHSAEWKDSVCLDNKTVAVIGTGASAAQIIPAIVDKVSRLEVFQRNPAWTVSRGQVAIPPVFRALFRYVPFLMKAYRYSIFWMNEALHAAFKVGTLFAKLGPLEHYFHLWRIFRDPLLRSKLTPTYPFGCKRIVKSNDLLSSLAKPHVHLHTDRIETITEDAIVTVNKGIVPVDVIVLATGFKVQDFFYPLKIFGRNSLDVLKLWRESPPKGYLGMTAAELPNSFAVIGPGTGLGHNSIVFMIECQVSYIIKMIQEMDKRNCTVCEVTHATQDSFHEYMKKHIKTMVWAAPTCVSWYSNAAGEVTALWPHSCYSYWQYTRHPDFSKYRFYN